ncbi:DUF5819 family protein [Salinithrix halophila]|uniref:DUF5819 family protein n=1 Tax=Salinithrix halophila TaxID=1485204 RepID=A0ABV8JLM5_9BACL
MEENNPARPAEVIKSVIAKRWALRLWIVLLAGIFVLHFSLTAFYLTPDNTLKVRWWEPLNRYMDPLFTQNWKLFAPNPVSQHKDLWVKIRYVQPDGNLRETGWKNITRPIFREKQTARISSEGRVIRYFHAGMRSFEEKDPLQQKKGKWMLIRAASTAVATRFPDKEIRKVKARIVTNTFPRFKERRQPDDRGPLQFRETEWRDYAPVKSPAEKEWPR